MWMKLKKDTKLHLKNLLIDVLITILGRLEAKKLVLKDGIEPWAMYRPELTTKNHTYWTENKELLAVIAAILTIIAIILQKYL